MIIILIFRLDLPMKKSGVIGTYISNEIEPFLAETPNTADTLILKPDGTFTSGFYGDGNYDVDYGLFTTKIECTYDYEMGTARHQTSFRNKIYEEPKIILNSDLNHFYVKVE